MITQSNSSRGTQLLFSLAAIVIIIAGVYFAQSVVVLFLLSFFLALLGTPLVLWLRGKRVPASIAVLIVMAIIVVIILLIGAQIASSFSSFSQELPKFQLLIREQVIELVAYLKSKGMVVKDIFFLEYINPESILKLTANLLSGFGSALSDLVLILITVTFILLEISSFPVKLRKIIGDPEQVFPRFTRFIIDMKRYMFIKTIINIAAGILIGLWMYILGVDFPVLWGFLAFLLTLYSQYRGYCLCHSCSPSGIYTIRSGQRPACSCRQYSNWFRNWKCY